MVRSKRMRVYYKDGREVEAAVGPDVQVKAERHFGASLLDLKLVEHAYYLAWAALTCTGLEHSDFESFLTTIDDVEAVDSSDQVRPTVQAQPPDTSSS